MDQTDSAPFNRGALLNVGFLEARKLDNFTCFVFHDVDMVPETDLMLYRCRESDQVSRNCFKDLTIKKCYLNYYEFFGFDRSSKCHNVSNGSKCSIINLSSSQ